MPEVRVARAGRNDQIVVGQLGAARQYGDAPLRVDLLHLGHQDFRILLLAEKPPNGRGDVRRRERRGRDLIQQRLEDVMIRTIDDCDVSVRVAELARGVQPPEPGANDEDAWPFHPWYSDQIRSTRPSASRAPNVIANTSAMRRTE